MSIRGFDHAAIPTADPEAMIRFYGGLGFTVPELEAFRRDAPGHFTIQLGENKINVHTPRRWRDERFTLRGPEAVPGCGDFCFVWSGTVDSLLDALEAAGAAIEEGPVERLGGRAGGRATGTSVYTRDPDRNLLEFIVYR